jgi:hypothetical protein
MHRAPSLLGCLLTGVLLALALDAALWAYFALWQHSEFASLGAALMLVFLAPSGLVGGLILYARGRISARRSRPAA